MAIPLLSPIFGGNIYIIPSRNKESRKQRVAKPQQESEIKNSNVRLSLSKQNNKHAE